MRSARFPMLIIALLISQIAWSEEPAGAGQSEGAPADVRSPIPATEKLKAAEEIIRDIFKEELKKTELQDQIALAKKFVEQAKGTSDDPAARYELLQMALTQSAHSGDIEGALVAIAAMKEWYVVDATKLKLGALSEIGRTAKTKEPILGLIQAYRDVANAALTEEDFSNALAALVAAQPFARAAQDIPLYTSIEKQIGEVNACKAAFDRVKAARITLTTKPDDPDANFALGKYLCINRGDWQQAMPLLAKAGDAKWSAPAVAELTPPANAADQVALADKWYELSNGVLKTEQIAIRIHAGMWYRMALPGLTGLTQTRVEKRVAEVQPLLDGVPTPASKPSPARSASVNDATNALPTQDELNKIEQLFKDAKNSGDREQNSKAWDYVWTIVKRMTEDVANFKEDDWKARDEAMNALSELTHKYHGNYLGTTEFWSKFPEWVAGAKDNAEFLKRLKFGLANRNKIARSRNEADRYRQALHRYLESKRDLFPTTGLKVQFCDWLKQNGVVDTGIDEYKAELLTNSPTGAGSAQVPQPTLAGAYDIYVSGKQTLTMELFPDGSIRNWKGQKKMEYHWSVNGDTLLLQWAATQDTFKIQADGKLVGTSPDTKNMQAEKKK